MSDTARLTTRYLEGGIGELWIRTDLQRPDAGADTRVHHRGLLAFAASQPRPRLKEATTMMWSEQPATAPAWTPREWAFYATCAQMRADRRREEARAERREFWRETKCELLAALAAFATIGVLVGARLLVMS